MQRENNLRSASFHWAPDVFSNYITRGMASLTEARIPSAEGIDAGPYWVTNYFLNTVMGPRFSGVWKQRALGFLWRTQQTYHSYEKARENTNAYLDGHEPTNPKIYQYLEALSYWEAFFLHAKISLDYLRQMNGAPNYSKGDRSVEERIENIGNHIKHMHNAIEDGRVSEDNTLPLVMTNHGLLASSGDLVAYDEVFRLLSELAVIADEFQNPGAMAEKAKQRDGQG